MARTPRSLTKREIQKVLKQLPAWELSANGKIISKKVSFSSPIDALSYLAKVTVISCVKETFAEITLKESELKIVLKKTAKEPFVKTDFDFCKRIEQIALTNNSS